MLKRECSYYRTQWLWFKAWPDLHPERWNCQNIHFRQPLGITNNTELQLIMFACWCLCLPGYFPPLFLWMKQMMRRIRMSRAMAHMRPMNHPWVAMSTCLLTIAVQKKANLKSSQIPPTSHVHLLTRGHLSTTMCWLDYMIFSSLIIRDFTLH